MACEDYEEVARLQAELRAQIASLHSMFVELKTAQQAMMANFKQSLDDAIGQMRAILRIPPPEKDKPPRPH